MPGNPLDLPAALARLAPLSGTRGRACIATALFALLPSPTLPAQRLSQTLGQDQQTLPPAASLIQQANSDLAAGDFPAALKILTTLNAQTPKNPEILYDLGLTLEALADTGSTGSQTRTSSPPPNAATPANNEQPTPQPDQPLTAESCYRHAIAANPLFAPAHVALGLLLARSSQSAEANSPRAREALTELRVATTLPEADPALKARAFRALARLELNANATGDASTDLLTALNLTPEAPEDILLAAEIAQAAADLPAAEQAYHRYLAVPGHEGEPAATASLAHIALAQHHIDEAESLLTTALVGHPGDPTLTAQLAAAYLSSGDDAEIAMAGPLLENLHKNNPQDDNITRLLARVLVETGRPDQADLIYAALISAQSRSGTRSDPTLLADRADALLRLHRPGEAEKLLKLAVADPAAFPTSAALGDAATHLAFAASEIDDPKGALQALALRSTVLPPTPSTLFLEATASDTLHQSAKAVDLYRQFLAAVHGDLPQQESQARRRLAELQHTK